MLTVRLARLGLLICFPLLAKIDPADWLIAKTANEEEALFLRRIADFWQEGEYGIAKSQMEEFLISYPESLFSDPLRMCLGDILLREKNFSSALACYSALAAPEFAAKAFLNRMQCLYSLEWYSTLADECEAYLKKTEDPDTSLKTTFYLSIALYHQCLNAAKDPESLLKLAKRAEPYFESLLKSDLSNEVSQAFAHLCCILKDYQKAVDIYLGLAAKEAPGEDEMTFQAALIQAEFDKKLALQSFDQLAKKGGKRAKEASYNHLVLSFEAGRYEALLSDKDLILASVPEERRGMARYFLGRSFLALKKYSEAIAELTAFLKESTSFSAESIQSGLLSLIEAAHQSGDVQTLDSALAKLSEINPSDSQVAKGRFLRALLLKNTAKLEESRQELIGLLTAFPDFSDRAVAAFEWADLEYQAGSWEACRNQSLDFVNQYPKHDLAPFAWRYFATASSRLDDKEQLISDLEMMLKQKELFSPQETSNWTFYLAESYFNLGRFENAMSLLQSILRAPPFSQEANARLLLGLCYRDGEGDLAAFCLHAEEAIAKQADLMDEGLLHISLFNAYLELTQKAPDLMGKSAEHLYEAFASHTEISRENLLWLGDWYFAKEDLPRASNLFSYLVEKDFDETASFKLGKLFAMSGRTENQIAEMEKLVDFYEANPSVDWKWDREARLLLAEGYAAKGMGKKALALLDTVTNGGMATRSETVARAFLEKAKISASSLKNRTSNDPALIEIATEFKNLILQRRLEQEPIHLEAALEYVDLLTQNQSEKRLALLEKIKFDFENGDDIIAKDYQQARLKFPAKNGIFNAYMKFIDEEILLAKSDLATDGALQKELQAKAKDLLLQIKSESAPPTLLKRVSSRLQNADAPVVD